MPMPTPFLSIILFDPFEMPASYLDLYFRALTEWNKDALEQIQVLVITQRQNDHEERLEIARRQPFDVSFFITNHEFVGGYPIWDNLSSARDVWRHVTGRYVTFHHPEFLWGPGRLRSTIDYLKDTCYYVANGNLRRPGTQEKVADKSKPFEDCVKSVSDVLLNAMNTDMQFAAEVFEDIPTARWMFMCQEQPYGQVPYIEDLFFADKEWLDSWRFIRHGGELPFQDVYDPFGMAFNNILHKFKIQIPCYRMDQSVNRMIHLYHRKTWQSWTPEVRDWFLSQPERWKDTKFLDAPTWEMFIGCNGDLPKNTNLKNSFRHVPGGTVNKYAISMSEWLQAGGARKVEQFYAEHGRYMREK
jgi:hypothetical protein